MTQNGKPAIWLLLVLVSAVACLDGVADRRIRNAPRGLILISLSGLRADALRTGHGLPSETPFLDSLAANARVYERALSTAPETLAAHVSLLSGLYPAEHRVVPPSGTLAADVRVLPELLAEYGYRTAGFTGGGYLSSDFGLDRGFDEFGASESGNASPFDRAIEFLRRIGDDRFFVFLHSDAIEAKLLDLEPGFEDDREPPGGVDFKRLIRGNDDLTTETSRRLKTRYLEALARLDRELESFFDKMEALGLGGRTVVVVTADHGMELGEHGRVGHAQVYPETLGVPLLVLGSGFSAERIGTLVQSVDIAPTLYALVGFSMPGLSGRILPGFSDASEPRRWAVAEVAGRWAQRSLWLEVEGRLYQGVWSRLRGERDGTWVTRRVTFDTFADRLEFSVVSFHEARTLRVAAAGQDPYALAIEPRWAARRVPLPRQPGRRRITITADTCVSPSEVGAGSDERCLSFKLRGLELSSFELFDLAADPGARSDVSTSRTDVVELMSSRLEHHSWAALPPPGVTRPRAATLAAIAARAENPEPPWPRVSGGFFAP